MNFFDIMNVSASGLTAQRTRMETVSSNLANAYTTRTENGEPYRRRDVMFKTVTPGSDFKTQYDSALRGVEVDDIVEDPSEFRKRYEPGHPDADDRGYVLYPNVEPVTEMVNLVSATRSYEANLTVIEATKSLMLRTLEI
jgi:flagellar basal-body rod protein FlgC